MSMKSTATKIRALMLLAACSVAFMSIVSTKALAASSLECPKGAVPASVKSQLPTADAFYHPQRIAAVVSSLRSKGDSSGVIIDHLIAAYCPLVAAQTGLSSEQKSERVTELAARVARAVYSPGYADEIVLDVAFPSGVVDAIDTKARAAGVLPEAWIQDVVNAALH